MIELIFAIVIIAISVISLPMMTQVTGRSMEGSLAQEAIFAASAQLNMVLSYKWDKNSQETLGELSKVIHTSATDCNTSDGVQRPGHVHRMCLNDDETVISPSISTDIADDSLGSRQVTDDDIFEGGTANQSGYKELYTMDIAVAFAEFDPGYSTGENIKEIEITVRDSDGPLVVLKTYSANIGEAEAAKRMF
jgi:type II secretory pathway pseudopilin PulG